MNTLLISLPMAVLAVVMSWRWPRWRQQLLWGSLFGLPVVGLQLLFAGGINRLGFNSLDALWTMLGLLIGGTSLSALAAVAFELTINRWLNPIVHLERTRFWWLGIGVGLWVVLLVAGVPGLLAVSISLFCNALVILFLGRPSLIWDALWSAGGLAVWYTAMELLFGLRTAGDLSSIIGDQLPIGLTLNGRPIEEVIIVASVGALLGPLFAATKPRRLPTQPRGTAVGRTKILVGLAMVFIWIGAVGWVIEQFNIPPRLENIVPAGGTTETPTTAELVLTFSRPIDRNSLALEITPAIDGTWSFAEPAAGHHGYRVARYHFATTLLPETTYRGQVVAIKSVWGYQLADVPVQFTTATIPDILSVHGAMPSGSTVTPAPGQPLDPCGSIIVELTSATDPAAEFSFTLDPPVSHTSSLSTDRRVYTLKPDACLQAGKTYTLHIGRRIVTRDPITGDTVAASDPTPIMESVLTTIAPPVTAAPPEQVLAAVTSAVVLRPVREQHILPIALDYQDQPLSCEAAALKMALAGLGIKVSEKTILAKIGYDPTPRKNGVWGDPNVAFVGNIAGRQNTTGYGVHWGPIARAAKSWRSSRVVRNATPELIAQEILGKHPVIIWGTLGRAYRDTWRTPSGKVIAAWKGEHARTIIGFYGPVTAPTHFVINDPIVGRLTWTRATLIGNSASFGMTIVVVQ